MGQWEPFGGNSWFVFPPPQSSQPGTSACSQLVAEEHVLHSAPPPRQSRFTLSPLPETEQCCSRLPLPLHTPVQKSPGRPWPFFSPRLVTFHCSELWLACFGVRENWLCWAGTTSCPWLVLPGSPLLRVSAQLPSPASGGSCGTAAWLAGQDAADRAPQHLSSPSHFSHSLRICVVPNHLDSPHPAADWYVQGVNSSWHQTCPHFLVPRRALSSLEQGIWSTPSFTCGLTHQAREIGDHGIF